MVKTIGAQALSLLAVASLPQLNDVAASEETFGSLRAPPAPSLNVTRIRDITCTNSIVLATDFVKDATLYRDFSYVVHGEVHVRSGVTLTIEDGATVLIRNGYRSKRTIDTSALIFDSGSGLRAGTVTFASADDSGARVADPNNGGVFFCGSYRSGTKDGVSSVRRFARSNFRAERIILDHVGRSDPREGDGNDNDRDDIDAISIIGVGQREWNVKGIESHGSGDDGFDAYNSSITLDTLIVANPTEDGVNLTSSSVTVLCYCSIDMSQSDRGDRELFDFEIDNGPCRVTLAPHTLIKLSGCWGNGVDEARLKSIEMPRPPVLSAPDVRYEFNGTLSKQAIIYSATSD